MKKLYLRYLFAHAALMALGGVLTAAIAVFSFDLGAARHTPLWALLAPVMAYAAYALGRKLRADDLPRASERYWNAAMAMYVLSLALLALLWKFPESTGAHIANVWNLPTAPVITGLDSLVGHLHVNVRSAEKYTLLYRTENYQTLILPILGALAAAVEPMALTLGFLHREKAASEAPDNKQTGEEETPNA